MFTKCFYFNVFLQHDLFGEKMNFILPQTDLKLIYGKINTKILAIY